MLVLTKNVRKRPTVLQESIRRNKYEILISFGFYLMLRTALFASMFCMGPRERGLIAIRFFLERSGPGQSA